MRHIIIFATAVIICLLSNPYVSFANTLIVAGGQANVRLGPGIRYPLITSLPNGTSVLLLETHEDWYKIRLVDGREGWAVSSNFQIRQDQRALEGPATVSVQQGKKAKRSEPQAIEGFWVSPEISFAFEIVAENESLHIILTRSKKGILRLPATQIGPNEYTYEGSQGTNHLTLETNRLIMKTAFNTYVSYYRATKNPGYDANRTVVVPRVRVDGSSWVRFLAPFYIDRTPVTNREFLTFVTAHPQWKKSRVANHLHDGDYLKHWQGDDTIKPKEFDRPVRYVSYYAAVAYCDALKKVLPKLNHYRAAEHYTGGGISIAYNEPYTAPELQFVHTEWTNTWWHISEMREKRIQYEEGIAHNSNSSSSNYAPARDKRYTKRSLGFRCITLIEP